MWKLAGDSRQDELATTGAVVALLGETLVDSAGQAHPTARALAGKEAVLLYFSASWCPPCKHFSPQLIATYKRLKAAGKVRPQPKAYPGLGRRRRDCDDIGDSSQVFECTMGMGQCPSQKQVMV